MKRENLSVTALLKELIKLSAVAVLTATTTLSVGTFSPQDSSNATEELVTLIETDAAMVEAESFEDDPFAEVRGLLGYIQRFESVGAATSQGVQSAYQVVYGGIAATDRPTEALTSMTVAEVLAWQDSIDARYPSEAAGAYQVMEDTLRGLVESGQVDPNALFNEETQDAVAEMLMERRGLSKYVGGKLSAEDFADNLAREWASFPVVRDQQGASRYIKKGQSYYAGDGLNKAHADADEFLSVVEGLLVPPAELPKATTTAISNRPEQVAAQREAPEKAPKTGSVTLDVAKPIDGPGKVSVTKTLNKDNLSVSFGGSHDEDGNTGFSLGINLLY